MRGRAAGDLKRDQREIAARLDFHLLRHEVRLLSLRPFDVAAEDRVDLRSAVRALRLREREERGRIVGEGGADARRIEIVQRVHEAGHRGADFRFVIDANGGTTGEQKQDEGTEDIRQNISHLKLSNPNMLQPEKEFPGEATVVMQTIWPNLIIQQQSNTLAVRQVVPRGVEGHELHWTFFGYADDDDDMTLRRLRQANLMGPAGYVSLDDGEVLALAQSGITASPSGQSIVEMGGDSTASTDHVVTEAAIRAFYQYYRAALGL